jgi:uncharacterized membrane protein YbaN (DUF454 family)
MLFFAAGTVSLMLGTIGVFLPILPTTPFLLLSVACYYKSSKRMHQWILNNRWFGEYIKNYKEGKGLSIRTKIVAITTLWIAISYSAFFVVNMWIAQLVLFAIAIAVSTHIIRLPTFKKT